jgi:hypothetical protein
VKDIDFDELDRAVSSVLSQNTAKDTVSPQEEPVKKTAPEPVTEDAVSEEPVATVTDVPDTSDESAGDTLQPTKPTPLAIKRRGKFMDVMHPSADMQPNAPAAPATMTRVARTAPVITPLLPEEAESAHHEMGEPVADLDESAALIGAAPAPVETDLDTVEATSSVDESEKADELEQTDALASDSDLVEQAEPADTQLPAESETLDTEVSVEETEEGDAAPEEKPTPFLSDTQVEKRPLGAFGDAEASAETAEADSALTESPVEELKPAAAPAALPRELQPDVVNVESVQEAEAEQAAATAGSASGTMTNPFAAKVGVAPDASDGRVEGHPLFDTSTYHEPIAAVHSHGMPGWAKWSLGLLACLAVGAGVGYFLFTAGL